jgi:hypothetical protein
VAERASERGERDAGVAARGFDDGAARLEGACLITTSDDVQRHPVLDGTREVQVLGLRVDRSTLVEHLAVDGEEGGVAREDTEALDAGFPVRDVSRGCL